MQVVNIITGLCLTNSTLDILERLVCVIIIYSKTGNFALLLTLINSSIAGKNVYEASKKSNENIPVIDLVSKGYFKLLGGGQINVPVIVKTKCFTKLAEKKN